MGMAPHDVSAAPRAKHQPDESQVAPKLSRYICYSINVTLKVDRAHAPLAAALIRASLRGSSAEARGVLSTAPQAA